jgi:ATP-dependent helicase/nuclease subunit A
MVMRRPKMTETPLSQAALLEAAGQKQRRAADPAVSAWVRANAGTGKTHVLVQRILRLLLSGANPRSILCLTFTKNAAAEMEARVLATLGEWVTSSEAALRARLAQLLAQAPAEAEMALARSLFAAVIDAPGGLAIMTIHSFCERVLRRYSLEANVPPNFSVLTEEEAQETLQEASSAAFASAAEGVLGEALDCVAAHAGEGEFARVLQAMLAMRNAIAHLFRVTPAEHPLPLIEVRLRRLFALAPHDRRDGLIACAASLLDTSTLKEAAAALAGGSKTDGEGAARFEAVLRADGAEAACAALKAAFTTKGGEPRKSLMTAGVKKRALALHERLSAAQEAFLALDAKLAGLKLVEASLALLRLGQAIFERYEAAKRARAALDFDDLIAKALSLLSRQGATEWVLYELDARIDHILVDEAQDTSPEQWAIVERLTSDFFAGEGARDCIPTLFAVGDEKQSIYGFQGAAPELLRAYGELYEAKVQEAGLVWCAADLDLSFRTLGPILAAVDDVSAALPGLGQGMVRHLAYRRESGGLVELWQPERGERQDKGTVWEPEAEAAPASKPAELLAARIATQIKHWLESGEGLSAGGRAIEPGDILILLRKREPMASLLQAALKGEGIPVAGADRMALIDELAVMDLLALGDALLQPEDDLSLAAVLKGPLFGFDEDRLFRLAYGREGSLWQALERDPANRGTAEKLRAWRELAGRLSPFDFFAHILEAEDGRAAFAARLGPECFDAIDELLNLAEAFSARPRAALSEFLAFVRKSASEVKRETDQAAREVRIMTVHGAKGLEANIVILADTCSNRGAAQAPVFLLDDTSGAPEIPVWAVKGTGGLQPVAAAKEAIKASEQREQGRLLYVAMTRAKDRLYIAGFHNGSLPDGSWYATIQNALGPKLSEAQDFQGRTIWRTGPTDASAVPARRMAGADGAGLPAWIAAPAVCEPQLQSISPSKLIQRLGGGNVAFEEPRETDRKLAQARGTVIHRLLETLPALSNEHWPLAARLIASAFASDLPAQRREDACKDALALLSGEDLRPFGANTLPEAGLGVAVRDATGKSIVNILGQADRIVFHDAQVTVIDYKSGALPAGAAIRPAHLAQLACYRLALKQIYPAANICAALFDIRSGTSIEAASEDLETALAEILNADGPISHTESG